MTSLTGKTQATLRGTVDPPKLWEALLGAVLQCGTVTAVWVKYTSFGACSPANLSTCLQDPWSRTVVFTMSFALVMWLASLRTLPRTGTSDPSIVDRLWSIMPWLYVGHWCFSATAAARPRLVIMAALSTAWGWRLTYNFLIKGGFSGGEDYRWVEIRTWFPPGWRWELFNLLFICFCQQLIVLAFSSPAAAALQSSVPLGPLDATAAALYAILLLGEAVADRQMFVFQKEKYRRKKEGEPAGEYSRGFIESGLWSVSRHPNYFCEVSIWWAFYLFSISASGQLINWTIVGPCFLTGLFVLPRASLDVTEALSSRKYLDYPDYQRRVSRFLPWPPSPPAKGGPATTKPPRWHALLPLGWFVAGVAVAASVMDATS